MTGYISFVDVYGHIPSDRGGLEVQGLQVPMQDVAFINLGSTWGTMGIKAITSFCETCN